MSALKVFSGWDPRQAEAAEVFRFSVTENLSVGLEFQFLKLGELPINRRGASEFTYTRFLVPWHCGFEGRAVFLDGVDMLCLDDVAELLDFDLGGAALAVVKYSMPGDRPRAWSSLMLMDCGRLTKWTPSFVEAAPDSRLHRLLDFKDHEIADLPAAWNVMMSRDSDPPPGTKIAHWSYLSDPDGDSFVDRSGSRAWAAWRRRWRETVTSSAVAAAWPRSARAGDEV